MVDTTIAANAAYDLVNSKASNNSLIQGVSGAFGLLATLPVDALSLPMIYGAMWNDIRQLYGHPVADWAETGTVLKSVIPEIVADVVLDKVMGNVPVVGIYFNAICAKMMTWRLGTLFAVLAARGPELLSADVRGAIALVRESLPKSGVFTFNTPDRALFVRLVVPEKPADAESLEDFYARVLELDGTITPESVKRQHAILMAQYHPDKVQQLGKELRDLSLRKARELNEAFAFFQDKFGFR